MSPAILSSEFSTPSSACSHRSYPCPPGETSTSPTTIASPGTTETTAPSDQLFRPPSDPSTHSNAPSHSRTSSIVRHPHVWELDSHSDTQINEPTTLVATGAGTTSRREYDDHHYDADGRDGDGAQCIPLVLDLDREAPRCDCTDCVSPCLLEDITPDKYIGDEQVADLLLNVSQLLSNLAPLPSDNDTGSLISERRDRVPSIVRPLPPIPIPVPAPIPIPTRIPGPMTTEVLYSPPPPRPSRLDREPTEHAAATDRAKPAGPRDARIPSSRQIQAQVDPPSRETQKSLRKPKPAFYIPGSPGRTHHQPSNKGDGEATRSTAPTATHPTNPSSDIHQGFIPRAPRQSEPSDRDGRAQRTFRVINTSPPSSGSDTDSLTPPGSRPDSGLSSSSASSSSHRRSEVFYDDNDREENDEGSIFLGSDDSFDDHGHHHQYHNERQLLFDDDGGILDRHEGYYNRRVRTVSTPCGGMALAQPRVPITEFLEARPPAMSHGMALAYVDASVNVVDADLQVAQHAKSLRSFFRWSRMSQQQQQHHWSIQSPDPQSPMGTSMDGWNYHAVGRENERRAGSEDWTHRRNRDEPSSSLSTRTADNGKPRRNRFVSMSLDLGRAFLLSPKSKASRKGRSKPDTSETEYWDAALPPHRGRSHRRQDHAGKEGRWWMSRIGLGSKG
ncbi:hypothetical protein IAT40_000497 [Kwoniella sp. CBS 6097]